jgi:LysM repeat protein
MVTMATKTPIVTMNHRRATGVDDLVRTRKAPTPKASTRKTLAPATPTPASPARLTRRGRMVVTGVSALVIGALSVGLATTAQATRAGSSPPGRYVTKVMVLPGQTLWSLAEAHDPSADTRLVIQQIEQLNAMTGDQIRPGEVLWVPRG